MVEELKAVKEGELAATLGLSTRTLQNWRATKPPRGPKFVRVGGTSVRYLVRDIEAWVREEGRQGR